MSPSLRLVKVRRAGTLTVTSNASESPQTVVLSGTASSTANYQGLWWNAPPGSEAGWGINLAHQEDVIFLTWFTHDANGKAWYLSMTAMPSGANSFSGTLYRTSGPPLDAVPFDASQVQRVAIGTGALNFSDGNNGTFTYVVNGIAQTKAITRQVFGPLPSCTWGLPGISRRDQLPGSLVGRAGRSESGWGINLTHQGDVIFATWFTYDFDGAALPMSVTLTRTGPGVYSGA
jgi:hypothetical protein